ncbi:MAG: LacI family DNA-binding transcriptional regulator [Fusobacterium sp.]|nr:LacI family DNA-binding transcriptional regulator [Fusobacterium sp.]
MITQKEIAEKLGVSRTTVARAINGSSLIKDETKKKILNLVKEMNYEKNLIGSSLAGRKSKLVSALMIKSKNEFYTQEIVRGLENAAKEYGAYNYRIEIETTDIDDPESQILRLKEILDTKDIDGIIITPLDNIKTYEILKPYLKRIKIISVGIKLHDEIPHIGPDHKKQGKIAGAIMSSLLRDNEKLLVLNNGDDRISSKNYLEGFVERVSQTDIKLQGPLIGNGIDKSIELISDVCSRDDIKGIYINRYAQEILEKLPKKILKNKKIVTNGISKNLKRLLKKGIVTATVMEEIATEGYDAGKKMFDILYRDKSYEAEWEVSKSHILFLENLEG